MSELQPYIHELVEAKLAFEREQNLPALLASAPSTPVVGAEVLSSGEFQSLLSEQIARAISEHSTSLSTPLLASSNENSLSESTVEEKELAGLAELTGLKEEFEEVKKANMLLKTELNLFSRKFEALHSTLKDSFEFIELLSKKVEALEGESIPRSKAKELIEDMSEYVEHVRAPKLKSVPSSVPSVPSTPTTKKRTTKKDEK